MDIVLRAVSIYLILLIVFRIVGRRSLAQITTFDVVLLLIIGEATQQSLLGDDFSVTNGALVVITLVSADWLLSIVKSKRPVLERVLDGTPVVLIDHGRLIEERIKRAGVDESDILEAARTTQGLERLDQIKYAVLERGGDISIVPQPSEG